MSDDPRKGLPSASGVERIMECPGSWSLCKITPKWGIDSAVAILGTKLHKALEKIFLGEEYTADLDADELAQVGEIVEQAWDACKKVFGVTDADRTDDPSEWPFQIFVEQRAWVRDGNLTQIGSGQLDLLFIADDVALLLDFKTGYGDTTVSEKNWQLIFNLIAFREQQDGIASYFAGILQPNRMSSPDLSQYSGDFLDVARHRALEGLREADEAKPYRLPLNPNAEGWCKYCDARKDCPALQYSLVTTNKNSPIIPAALEKAMAVIRKEDLPDWLDRGKETELLIGALKDYAKELLTEDPESVKGYELKPGNNLRKIEDVAETFAIFRDELGVTSAEFLAATKVGTGALEKLHIEKTGLKGIKAKNAFNDLLDPVIKMKQNSPTLTKTI